LKNTIKQQKIN